VGLSILGVGVIFYEGLRLEGASLIGDLLVLLLAAVGFGAYTVLSMRALVRYSPLAAATFPILFGAPLVLLLSDPFFTRLEWEGVGMGAWAAVVLSAIFATAFAFSAWQTGVSRIGANRVLVYQYLISLTGVASGIVFFGETLERVMNPRRGCRSLAGGRGKRRRQSATPPMWRAASRNPSPAAEIAMPMRNPAPLPSGAVVAQSPAWPLRA